MGRCPLPRLWCGAVWSGYTEMLFVPYNRDEATWMSLSLQYCILLYIVYSVCLSGAPRCHFFMSALYTILYTAFPGFSTFKEGRQRESSIPALLSLCSRTQTSEVSGRD